MLCIFYHNFFLILKQRKWAIRKHFNGDLLIPCAWVHAKSRSHVWLFATLWTVVHQVPLSMGFSQEEDRSGFPCPPPGNLLTRELNPHLLHCRRILYPLSHLGEAQFICRTLQLWVMWVGCCYLQAHQSSPPSEDLWSWWYWVRQLLHGLVVSSYFSIFCNEG